MTDPGKRNKVDVFIEIFKDPDRKSIPRIIYEFFFLLVIYREVPRHYFSRFLFKNGVKNIRDYLPNKFLGTRVTPFFNDTKFKELLDNKLYFALFYSQFDIRLPKIVMYNHSRIFVIDHKSIEVNNFHDFCGLLDEIFKQNPLVDSIIIKKTYSSSSGKKIFKLYPGQYMAEPETVNDIFSEVISSEFLFQETIKQHPEINKLTSSSINTIRIDTFINKEGSIDVISAHLRMSTNNIPVDNIDAGGCFVSINLQTGKLKKFGYSAITRHGVKVRQEHPVSKTLFENLTIPFFSEVKELVKVAAALMPGLRLVGWDVAIGETGPVLVEGNSDYEIRGNDFADGGYLSNSTFRKVLKEINYL